MRGCGDGGTGRDGGKGVWREVGTGLWGDGVDGVMRVWVYGGTWEVGMGG